MPQRSARTTIRTSRTLSLPTLSAGMETHMSAIADITDITGRRWATTDKAATYAGFSPRTFRNARSDPSLNGPPFYRRGGRVLYDLSEVDQWIAAGRVDVAQAA